ncbi:hypothetical protein [Yersinia alsatica]|uniref:hypothetical protein n=1 Tax=Yersinia alsatica TaxID=2890317 RepID=UPI00119F3E62|nr:hypothetical protein [Yersinia alsatica]
MNKLTEQQLQKIANPGKNDIGGAQSPIVTQMAAELLSLRAELASIKNQKPTYWLDVHGYQTYLYFNEKDATEACMQNGGLYVKPVYDGPTVAAVQDAKVIEDNLIEQVGLMCDRAVNIHEKISMVKPSVS